MGRVYPLGLAGESNYQSNIRRLSVGSPLTLRVEPDNPFDPDAIAVECPRGTTIGYIPRGSFAQDVILDQERPVAVHVRSIEQAAKTRLGVVVDFEVNADKPTRIYTGRYSAPEQATTRPKRARRTSRKSSGLKPILKIIFRLFR